MDKTTYAVRLQQWSEIIQAQLSSGMSKKDWCQENNVSEKQFYYWQRKVRRELYEAQAGALVPGGSRSCASLVELPVYQQSVSPAAVGFRPDAVIAVGNVTIGIKENTSEALLMNIGKMIRHAL